MVIWKEVLVPIIHKIWHIHKVGKKLHRDFTKDCGDIPVARFNKITGKLEEVVNPRGRAYATRNRFKYRKKKK